MQARLKLWRLVLAVLVVVLAHSPRIMARQSTNFPTIGRIVRVDNRINDLIGPDAKIEILATGFEWCEGPLWIEDAQGGYLLLSDIQRSAVMKWNERAGVSLFMKPSGYTGVTDCGREPGSNGLTLDLQGRIIFCEHGDRRI